MQIALGRNINAQVSFGRMSFSKNNNSHNIRPFYKDEKCKRHPKSYDWPLEKLPEKINIDSVSVGLSYKF